MARFGFDQVTVAPIVAGSDGAFTSDPPDFRLELTTPGSSTASGLLVRVSGARWTGTRAGTSFVSPMVLEGQLNVRDLIHATEVLVGLDEGRATVFVAERFHLNPLNLPDTVPFAGEFIIIPAD
jgi:hypothetical protein